MVLFRRRRARKSRESLLCTECDVRVVPASVADRDAFFREHIGCLVTIEPADRRLT
jgi:hypothetical protein